MTLVVHLEECAYRTRQEVGGKALSLGQLCKADVPVPDGWCLTTELLRLVQKETLLGQMINESIEELWQHPVLGDKLLARLRSATIGIDLPKEAVSVVVACVAPLLERGPVVVRSSVPDEDSVDKSHAGVYYSETNIQTIDDVINAVRRCWASLYTEQSFFYNKGKVPTRMAVIIQQYVRSQFAGVMFTRDPTNMNDDIVIEFNDDTDNESITAGNSADHLVRLQRHSDHSHATELGAMYESLRSLGVRLERLLGMPVDVEWVWVETNAFVLQARPITNIPPVHDKRTVWVDQENVAEVYRLDLGLCTPMFMRTLQKKVWVRQYCKQHGFRVPRVLYIVYDEEGLRAHQSDLLDALATPYVRVRWQPSFGTITTRTNLVALLNAGRENNRVRGGAFTCAQLSEVEAWDVSGAATCLSDKQVWIEALPAIAGITKEGAVEATTYLVGTQGQISPQKIATFEQRGVVDVSCGQWIEQSTMPFALTLPVDLTLRIAHVTRALTQEFGEVRLEWDAYGNDLYVTDLSVEIHTIDTSSNAPVLSSGVAIGTVFKIENTESLVEIAQGQDISVVQHTITTRSYSGMTEILERMRTQAKCDGGIIVVAEYPSVSLIPFIRHAKGFVFTRGTLLCHTAIVLRENMVPGIIMPHALKELQTGDVITVSPAGVVVMPRTNYT